MSRVQISKIVSMLRNCHRVSRNVSVYTGIYLAKMPWMFLEMISADIPTWIVLLFCITVLPMGFS